MWPFWYMCGLALCCHRSPLARVRPVAWPCAATAVLWVACGQLWVACGQLLLHCLYLKGWGPAICALPPVRNAEADHSSRSRTTLITCCCRSSASWFFFLMFPKKCWPLFLADSSASVRLDVQGLALSKILTKRRQSYDDHHFEVSTKLALDPLLLLLECFWGYGGDTDA